MPWREVVNVICPSCFVGVSLPNDWVEGIVRCRKCRHPIRLPAADGDEANDEEDDGEDDTE
jgi:hypothetical protein